MDERFPPGPREPAAIQLWWYLTKPLELFATCHARYGDLFTLKLGPLGRWVFVCSPELAKTVFTAPSSVFMAGAAKAKIFAPLVGTTSSLVLDGAEHLSRRRMLQPVFRGDNLQGATQLIVNATETAIAQWARGSWFAAHERLQEIAFAAVVSSIFGTHMGEGLSAALSRFVRDAVGSRLLFLRLAQHDLGRLSPWGRVLRAVRGADEAIFAEIARRRREGDAGATDILGLLLSVRDESGNGLSDAEIRSELLTMVSAGHEITGLSLAWALVSLSSSKEALGRARGEAAAALGTGDPSLLCAQALPYLDACIKESLRLHSAVPSGSLRVLSAPFTLGDYHLPPETMVNVCIDVLHRRADLYAEPDRFVPERFLETKINPYQWVPFGGGVRRCLGMAYGLHEMLVVLATLINRFEFEIAPKTRAVRHGAFVKPSGGPRIRVWDCGSTGPRGERRAHRPPTTSAATSP